MGKTSFDRKTRTGEPEQDKKALHQLKAVTGLWILNARIHIMEDLLDHDPDPGGEKSLKMRQKKILIPIFLITSNTVKTMKLTFYYQVNFQGISYFEAAFYPWIRIKINADPHHWFKISGQRPKFVST